MKGGKIELWKGRIKEKEGQVSFFANKKKGKTDLSGHISIAEFLARDFGGSESCGRG